MFVPKPKKRCEICKKAIGINGDGNPKGVMVWDSTKSVETAKTMCLVCYFLYCNSEKEKPAE